MHLPSSGIAAKQGSDGLAFAVSAQAEIFNIKKFQIASDLVVVVVEVYLLM
jgi:hypothetical protein